MGHTLEAFAAECRKILKAENNPAGRKKVCTLLQDVLKDESFVAKHLDDTTPERKILYEDPDLGFCILAHRYDGAKESNPHDHGPSWAIYGQAKGETAMNDWELLEPATHPQCGAKRARRVVLVRDRHAEHRHHRVADELLDRASFCLDLLPHRLPVRAEHVL